jgi:protein-tyrosine phosphatase
MQTSAHFDLGPGLVTGPAPGGYAGAGLQADLQHLADRGFRHLVCLIEDAEFAHLDGEPSPESFLSRCRDAGLTPLRRPIEDFAAPTLADVVRVAALVGAARSPVYVHCMAGLGRAGTIAAALLVREGMPAPDAMALVRWSRPGSIQSEAQEVFLEGLRPG